ncbi:hypothetical protein F442_01796 [Phytophthora nicotianae P10297]|uniref:BZIP domain-containing protein n=1 Tax=Phytophthora nicotianae P10297 TaxID=1317064 RepID=W3A448_PHYNI|nr:hypothetical protein F442_01796 [Phytophthora nicotianae P10297]
MTSSLHPPTSYSLRDVVIGSVVDRVALHHSKMGLSFLADPEPEPRSATELHFSNQKQFPRLTTTTSENTTELSFKQPGVFIRRVKRRISTSRREQCRINQARYRSRQREHEKTISSSICRLRVDIRDLKIRRQDLKRRSRSCNNVWSAAIEYFRLFQRGFMAPLQMSVGPGVSYPSLDANTKTSITAEERPHQPHAQIDFLRETMAHDMTDGVVCGVEALLQNWKLLSFYHGDLYVQLQRLDHVTKDSLQATITVSLTITESTLQNLYPHLLDSTARDIDDGQRPSLAAKLLNQRIVVHGSVRFDWDEANSRVMRLESKLDLLSSILELLGSLEAVALVFDSALVTPEGRFLSEDLSCDSRLS